MLKAQLVAAWFAVTQLAAVPAPSAPTPVSVLPEDKHALDAAERDLCGRRIALLGEGPTHGDGHTEAFKVALVSRLVDRCGYRAIAFESGVYEFIAFNRALRSGTATPALLSNAIGGLWRYDREFQPLVDFMFLHAKSGQIDLTGLDFQIGGLDEPFTNERMIPELAQALPPEQAKNCRAAFERHVQWSYPTDRPYGPADRDALMVCAAAMQAALKTDKTNDDRMHAENHALLTNIQSMLEDDLGDYKRKVMAREDALHRNFQAFVATLRPRTKIIVWGATTHLAKDANAAWNIASFRSLGERIHLQFGDRAFSLGFSALGGSYRYSRKRIPIATPPGSALEREAFLDSRSSAAYLDARQLHVLGVRPSGGLDHVYRNLDWSKVVDGMVVFRDEWPSQSTRPGYESPSL